LAAAGAAAAAVAVVEAAVDVGSTRSCRRSRRSRRRCRKMKSLRHWVGVQAVRGFLPVVIAMFLCSPLGAAVAFAGTPHDGGARMARGGSLTLGGLTSKGWPVYIQLSANGKQVVRAVAAIETPCSKGSSLFAPDKWTRVPIRHGLFRTAFRDSFTDQGQQVDFADVFTGKVNRKRTVVSGTWSVKLTIHEADGSVDTCDSGVLRYTARR
jgi:hypothetical protein